MRLRLALIATLVSLGLSACSGSSSPTTPTTPTAPTIPTTPATRIISITGDLAFGNVNFGDSPTRVYTISNSGNAPLTFTGLTAVGGTGSAGFTAQQTSGTIAPGTSQSATMRFTPTVAQTYSNVLTVVGDQTSGSNTLNVSGTGINNTPLFTKSGSGANVFDLPTTIKRIRIFGDYSGRCENFIVHIAGRSVVNEILGSCSVATSASHFDGTFVTTGGVVEVTNSSGISWTLVEVR